MIRYGVLFLMVASCAFAASPTTDSGYGSGMVYNPESSRDVLFDQELTQHDNTGTSEYIAAYDLRSIIVDDFEIEMGRQTIENVDIWVGWWTTMGTAQTISVRIYEDDGGAPTGAPEGGWLWEYLATSADWENETVGTNLELYEIDIPSGDEPEVDADTTYWFGFQVEHTFPPQAGAGMHNTVVWGEQSYFASEFFGYPNWVTGSTIFGSSTSSGFILYGTTIVDETDPTVTDTYPHDADYPSGIPPTENVAGCHWQDGDPEENLGIDIDASSFEVYDSGMNLVDGVLTIDDADLFDVIVDFEADEPWLEGELYTVDTTAYDAAGNSAEETWQFTTGYTNITSTSVGVIKAGFAE
jgi:hypothetical protein